MKSLESDSHKDFLENPALLFEAISHNRRIKIIQLLVKTPSTFSEIKHSLNISSSGNLTHHLNKLNSIIIQDSKGKYTLTELGHEALLSVEIAKRSRSRFLQESYTWSSALIFYGIYMTFAFYSKDSYAWISNFWVPILGLGLTLIYFCIISFIIKNKIRKGEWHFIFGRKQKNS